MKTYRVSDATIERLVKEHTRVVQNIALAVLLGIVVLMVIVMFISGRELDGRAYIELIVVAVAGGAAAYFMPRQAVKEIRRRANQTLGKYEITLFANSFTIRDHLMAEGINVHKNEIRSLQDSASGNELMVNRNNSPTILMISNNIDGYEEIRQTILAWAPFDPKPMRVIGQRYLPIVIGFGVVTTLCPAVPLWFGLAVGVPFALVYGYVVIAQMNAEGVQLHNKFLNFVVLIFVALATIARVALLVMGQTQ